MTNDTPSSRGDKPKRTGASKFNPSRFTLTNTQSDMSSPSLDRATNQRIDMLATDNKPPQQPSDAQSSPSATTKTDELTEILGTFDGYVEMALRAKEYTLARQIRTDGFNNALAAINNYTTQRVIEELEWVCGTDTIPPPDFEQIKAHIKELKGGIDE